MAWKFGGRRSAAAKPGVDAPSAVPAPDVAPAEPAEALAATASLAVRADAPASPAQRAADGPGVPAPSAGESEVPSAEDVATSRQFEQDLLQRSVRRESGILGPNAGFESTAVFASETQRLGAEVRSHDIFDEVSRDIDAPPTFADSHFVDTLPSLMSFADPSAIVEGRAADATLGARVSRKEELPSAISEIWALTQAGKLHTGGGPEGQRIPARPDVRRTPAIPVTSPSPEPRYRVAGPSERPVRRLSESVSHESAHTPAAPIPETLVARSVDARETSKPAVVPPAEARGAELAPAAGPGAGTVVGHETFRARSLAPAQPVGVARSIDATSRAAEDSPAAPSGARPARPATTDGAGEGQYGDDAGSSAEDTPGRHQPVEAPASATLAPLELPMSAAQNPAAASQSPAHGTIARRIAPGEGPSTPAGPQHAAAGAIGAPQPTAAPPDGRAAPPMPGDQHSSTVTAASPAGSARSSTPDIEPSAGPAAARTPDAGAPAQGVTATSGLPIERAVEDAVIAEPSARAPIIAAAELPPESPAALPMDLHSPSQSSEAPAQASNIAREAAPIAAAEASRPSEVPVSPPAGTPAGVPRPEFAPSPPSVVERSISTEGRGPAVAATGTVTEGPDSPVTAADVAAPTPEDGAPAAPRSAVASSPGATPEDPELVLRSTDAGATSAPIVARPEANSPASQLTTAPALPLQTSTTSPAGDESRLAGAPASRTGQGTATDGGTAAPVLRRASPGDTPPATPGSPRDPAAAGRPLPVESQGTSDGSPEEPSGGAPSTTTTRSAGQTGAGIPMRAVDPATEPGPAELPLVVQRPAASPLAPGPASTPASPTQESPGSPSGSVISREVPQDASQGHAAASPPAAVARRVGNPASSSAEDQPSAMNPSVDAMPTDPEPGAVQRHSAIPLEARPAPPHAELEFGPTVDAMTTDPEPRAVQRSSAIPLEAGPVAPYAELEFRPAGAAHPGPKQPTVASAEASTPTPAGDPARPAGTAAAPGGSAAGSPNEFSAPRGVARATEAPSDGTPQSSTPVGSDEALQRTAAAFDPTPGTPIETALEFRAADSSHNAPSAGNRPVQRRIDVAGGPASTSRADQARPTDSEPQGGTAAKPAVVPGVVAKGAAPEARTTELPLQRTTAGPPTGTHPTAETPAVSPGLPAEQRHRQQPGHPSDFSATVPTLLAPGALSGDTEHLPGGEPLEFAAPAFDAGETATAPDRIARAVAEAEPSGDTEPPLTFVAPPGPSSMAGSSEAVPRAPGGQPAMPVRPASTLPAASAGTGPVQRRVSPDDSARRRISAPEAALPLHQPGAGVQRAATGGGPHSDQPTGTSPNPPAIHRVAAADVAIGSLDATPLPLSGEKQFSEALPGSRAAASPQSGVGTNTPLVSRRSDRGPGAPPVRVTATDTGAAASTSFAEMPLVQRAPTNDSPGEEPHHEATASLSDVQTTGTNHDQSVNLDDAEIDRITERIWQTIRRKLRIERERSQGAV